jgi:transaldolase
MLQEAREVVTWSSHVVVTLPTTVAGVTACKVLSSEGIRVNMTLCFSAAQALLVAKAGARYCSPFVGQREGQESHAPRHTEGTQQDQEGRIAAHSSNHGRLANQQPPVCLLKNRLRAIESALSR